MTDVTDSLRQHEAECADGRTAPRVSLQSMLDRIEHEYTFTIGEVLDRHMDGAVAPVLYTMTLCVCVMKNGFVVVGKSAPASAANFDRALGARLAKDDVIRQLWPLEAYLLREKLSEV